MKDPKLIWCQNCEAVVDRVTEVMGYCSECCEHDELEDGHCLDCGESRIEDLAAAAYDRAKAARYGGDY